MSWDVEELAEAVSVANSYADVARRLGLTPSGGNPRNLRRWIETLGLSTAHFTSYGGPPPRRAARPLAEVLVERSSYPRAKLKARLYSEGLKQRHCESCGQGEEWRGRRMALILDHINGIPDDNRLENLRIVCPNCAATLETHCGRKNRKVAERPCERCGSVFRPAYPAQRFCSRRCGTRASPANRGVPAPERRKVPRPPLAQLLDEVRADGFAATGRRYGVSDNAIRKWILAARRAEERGGTLPGNEAS